MTSFYRSYSRHGNLKGNKGFIMKMLALALGVAVASSTAMAAGPVQGKKYHSIIMQHIRAWMFRVIKTTKVWSCNQTM